MFNFSDSVVQRLARWISNPEVVGSNPAAINMSICSSALNDLENRLHLKCNKNGSEPKKYTAPAELTLPLPLTGSEVFAIILVVALVTCAPIGPFLN